MHHLLICLLQTCLLSASATGTDQGVQFSPTKIRPNDGYTLLIDLPDGTQLDYELRYTPLDLSSVTCRSGAWGDYTVREGKVVVPAGQGFAPGIYMTRFKPRGAPDDQYTPFDGLMVDRLATMNPLVKYGKQRIPLPPAGAYGIYENHDGQGNFVGYTRIDIETDPCKLGGITMRKTKTEDHAYWNAGRRHVLRWCVDNDQTPIGEFRGSPGGTLYYSTPPLKELAHKINVRYDDNGLRQSSTQGLLGGFALGESRVDRYHKRPDMLMHYSLLPPDHRVPVELGDLPVPIVELAFGTHSSESQTFIDTWHTEALAPNAPGAVMRIRYNETGLIIHTDHVQIRWSVTEDWNFMADGMLARITQWREVPALSWRGKYVSTSEGNLLVDAKLIDLYVPDEQPIDIALKTVDHPKAGDQLSLQDGQSYVLLAKRSDGGPYSGFLEIKTDRGETSLWCDRESKPIYVSNGQVIVGPQAYGTLKGYEQTFSARPYLTNSSLNTLYPCTAEERVPNAAQMPFSRPVTLLIGE